MNILYIAYSCSPNYGSEDKIGWNVPVTCSKEHQVYVLTKKEHQPEIEAYLSEHHVKNIAFYYVDIPRIYKKVFRSVFYSGRLNIWNKRAQKVAAHICKHNSIDLIHQITPVEFRSIGNYWKISGVKFVCGPIAGGQSSPNSLKSYQGIYVFVEWIRSVLNALYRCWYKISRKLQQCDHIFYANNETRDYLQNLNLSEHNTSVLSDVSVASTDLVPVPLEKIAKRRFIVVGRLVYLKGHQFLLDALKRIPAGLDYECRIVGDGPEMERLKKKCKSDSLEPRVTFAGAIPYNEISTEYDNADVLILPSFREATGSVVLEAMARGLPVITINKFGGATILDNDTGWLYDGSTKEEYIENLKNALVTCISNPEEVSRKAANARKRAEEYTWEARMEKYQQIYDRVLFQEH